MSHELLPCPFCGGDANAKPHSQHLPGCYFDAMAQLKAAPKGDLSMAPEVVRAWNRRATQPAAGEPEARELLRQAFRLISTTVPEGVAAGLDDPSKQAWWYRECNPTSVAISEYLSNNPAPPAAAHGDEAVRWVPCSQRLPDIANGGNQHFLVSVYRAQSGESSVFEAHFLRDYPLYNEALGDETGEYLATGWFNQVPDIEFDEYYEPIVRKESGDEVTHWMPMPTPAMRAQAGGEVTQ